MKLWLLFACLTVVGCAAEDGSEPAPPNDDVVVGCIGDQGIHVFRGYIVDELARDLRAIVHHAEYRQEKLVQAFPNLQAVAGGAQATVACDGGTHVEFWVER